ncbi:MAG: hypothetical protein HUJ69_07585 [Lachnospiraceae bacterium]|nr:hypothetical protein [Lachnospiraceae bacterium]
MSESVKPTSENKKKKKHFSQAWKHFVEIYTIALLLIGVLSCALLYFYLDAFEKSQHKYVMDALMDETGMEQWKDIVTSASDMEFSSFDDTASILEDYFNSSCIKTPTYSEAVSISTEDAPVYNVKSGSAYMARVYLVADKKLSFGRNTWKVGHIEPYIPMTSFASTTIRVEVNDDENVWLNGKQLAADQLIAQIAYEELNAIESQYAIKPCRLLYEVTNLCGSIKVTLEDGTEIHPQSEKDASGALMYLSADPGYDMVISAPGGVNVLCGEYAIGQEYKTGSTTGFLKDYKEYTGGLDGSFVEYTIPGFHRKPAFSVINPGNVTLTEQVTPDGKIEFFYENNEDLQDDKEWIVDRFFMSYIWYGAGYESEYYDLLSYILPGTDLYTYVEDSTAAMIWASDTSIDFEYLEYTNFVRWGEDCFSCRAAYKATTTSQAWYENFSRELENTYDLVFIYKDGRWRAASMSVVN